jgi:heat shock protein HslJ
VTPRPIAGALLLISLVLVTCADDAGGGGGATGGDADPSGLTGVVWTLTSASIDSMTDGISSSARVTIEFEDDQAHGAAACNSYGGRYRAGDDGTLSFEAFAVTEMACEQPLMSIESAYLAALADVDSFRIEGSLVLSGSGVTLTFSEDAPPAPLPLVGTTWRLTTFAAGDVVFSVLSGTEITAMFAENEAVAGSAGCNGFSGTYESTGSSLSFSGLATTKIHCSGQVMAQESAFIGAMGKVASFSIDGMHLLLLDEDSALLLSFDGSTG